MRDRHRCVVSRKFDKSEASRRWKQDGDNFKDDDRNLLKNKRNDDFQYLDVAHILPHCLTAVASQDIDLVRPVRWNAPRAFCHTNTML